MSNPLLNIQYNELPIFSSVLPEHVEPAIEQAIEKNKKALKALLENPKNNTWETLIWPIEIMEGELSDLGAVISHLNSVKNTPDLYKAYQSITAKLALYHTEMNQNEELYQAYLKIRQENSYSQLSITQQKIVENALKDFELSGINLSLEKRDEFKKLNIELTELESQFEQNVLEATDAWSLHVVVEDGHKLRGLPENALQLAGALAKEKGLSGWLLTLDYPCYHAVITYAENRTLRKELYEAYSTRASALFPPGTQWDNSEIMVRIMQIRQKLATLLGFRYYSEYALATRMLKVPNDVTGFLEELVQRSRDAALNEAAELKAFAMQECQISQFEVWDTAYVSEKMRQQQFSISEEELRKYFPEDRVLEGLFNIVQNLYNLTIQEIVDFDRWHESVRLFEVYDASHILRGKFYLDLYARPNKKGGAWVATCKVRMKNLAGNLQTPVTFLTTNFSQSANNTSALLNHDDEVVTLFHEFGHCLHNILTMVDYPSVAGYNGVYWDAVELPSQLLENWCWEAEALNYISRHVETKQSLPQDTFLKLKTSKKFQAGLFLVKQLEYALFDFELHNRDVIQNAAEIQNVLGSVRIKTAVIHPPALNRFQHGFTHIFSGGYAAGYYSYLWSEVMSLDVFDQFKEKNLVFDKHVAMQFLTLILEQGGSKDFMELFIDFRGRPPKMDALLREYGLKKSLL